MSKKKQKQTVAPFKSNPFDSMKGFSVSQPQHAPSAEKKVEPIEVKKHVDVETEVDFNSAMSQLGVVSLDDQQRDADLFVVDEEVEEQEVILAKTPSTDEEIFLDSLGELDCVFSDQYDDSDADELEQSGGGEPRRMKQLRQGKLKPQETLDLHGCYRDEAREQVRHFLKNRHGEGLQTVLIITGKGNRSPNGESVLRSDVESYLTTHSAAWVVEWGRAPRQYGGEGALVVFLRQSK
ncbi:MAG: hypothetical protein B6I37_05510 [Desulfobacteraceae bacterium 4572_35.2]|nr:MAG: hypothetical protein B6I37_05510 [Desulfobacteraceae bacterium 4572_35.2]